MREALVSGVGMVQFGRFPERSLKDLSAEAIRDAAEDAGVDLGEVQAVFFGNAIAGLMTGQECIRGETVMHALGVGSIAVNNVENACASGGNALHLAWSSVAGGQYDTVLAIGCEKMFDEDKSKTFQALIAGMDLDYQDYDEGAGELRSPFIDHYEKVAQTLMSRGVTEQALANVASKAHHNGSLNPKAQRRKEVTPEEVLASRRVLGPLRVLMCSPVGDGAAAAVVTSKRTSSRDVSILGSQLRSLPAHPEGPSDCHEVSSQAVYEQSGVGPDDLDFAEVHDATSVGEMISWVEAGLCPEGEEQRWAMEGHTRIGGPLPVNPSGGLVARGHPVGATGMAQAYEAVTQLRGEAGPRQVDGARRALIQCGGGLIKQHTAVSSAHVLGV